ncbi:MAG TPA: Holliday junction resolvase-like protein [Gemmatimonadales bacterium]
MPDRLLALALGLAIGLLLAAVYFLLWKARYTRTIRREAALQSRAVTVGQVSQEFAPFLPGFDFNPKDARFLGSPVDFVVFDGLDAGDVRRVVFVEIKTGGADLSARERQVKDAIVAGRVAWTTLRH